LGIDAVQRAAIDLIHIIQPREPNAPCWSREMRPAGAQRVPNYITLQIMLDSTTRMCYDDGDLAKPNLESAMLDLALPGHAAPATNMRCIAAHTLAPRSRGMYELGFMPMHVHCFAVTSE
jgi:hypothetical protein